MAALPYINNPFILDRVDVAGVPISTARTSEFINFMKTFADQQPKAYPMVRGVTGQVASWGTPWVKGQAGDPIWKLKANAGYSPDSRAAFLGTTGFHAPDTLGTLITGTADSPFAVFDAVGGFTIFGTVANVTATHEITCSAWGVTYHNTNGLSHDNPKSDGPNNITSRGRLSDAMAIRRDLVDAAIAGNTGIGHVLHLFITETNQSDGFCHPMTNFENKGFGFGAEGERLRIKPGVNLATRGMSPFGLAIARTLQQHGCYIGDNASKLSSLKAQQWLGSTNPWSGLAVSEDALVGTTWDDWEVVQQGWQGTSSGGGGGGGGGGSVGATVVQHKSAKVDSAQTCTATFDAPVNAGNQIIAIMVTSGASSNAIMPTGYTKLGGDSNTGGTNIDIARKVAVGGETSVTYTCATAGTRMGIVVYEVVGAVADPTLSQFQNSAASNSVAFGPDTPQGLEIAAIVLGTDSSSSVAGNWPSPFTTDEKVKTAATSNNVQLIAGSVKQEGGLVSPTFSWTGTAVTATGFLLNFPSVAPPAANAHYVWNGTAWVARTRYRWSGTAWVATV
jgi:hypothetical protein